MLAARLKRLKIVGDHGKIIAIPITSRVVRLNCKIKLDGLNNSQKRA